MPFASPHRITILQVLALLAIWGAAIHGLLKPSTRADAQSITVKARPDATCARAFRES